MLPLRWTLVTDAADHPGWRQMAIDQGMLERAARSGEGAVRLYRWAPSCLSFGRNEPALRRYDRAEIERRNLDAVRRPTGGRAVWHARELTYAVAAPIAWFGTLAESYRRIHVTIAASLSTLGVPVTLAESALAAGLHMGACFASPAGGELLTHGRKLLGSAQLRQGSAFLQHGSLLLEDDQQLLRELTLGAAPESDEITLSEVLGRPISFAEVAAVVAEGFGSWEGAWKPGDDRFSAEALALGGAERFRDPAWTWRR